MPSRAQIEHAIHTHFDAWNRRDKPRWIANFATDIVMEDPVGGPVKHGPAALDASWENSFKEGHTWNIEPLLVQICTDQAAIHVRSTGSIDGTPIVIDGIEIYTVNDAGRVCYIKTYFNPPEGQTLDPYFMELHQA